MTKVPQSIPAPSRNDRLVVAVSGGADSLALLGLLFETSPRPTRQLIVSHVNYGLRGKDSRRDEEHVRDLAKGLRLPFRVLRVSAKSARIARRSGSLQDRAREIRYAFFSRVARAERAWGVAVAHHRDDQAETVLDRLLRGAGSRGLSGLHAVQELRLGAMDRPLRIWRPLLHFKRDDLLDYLKSRRIVWREDASNHKDVYRRNRLRHEVIPYLSRFDSRAVDALVRTGEMAAADEEYLETRTMEMDTRLKGVRTRVRHGWPRTAFAKVPLALQRRLVRRAAERLAPDARGLSLERIDEAVRVLVGTLKGPRDMGYALKADHLKGLSFLERA